MLKKKIISILILSLSLSFSGCNVATMVGGTSVDYMMFTGHQTGLFDVDYETAWYTCAAFLREKDARITGYSYENGVFKCQILDDHFKLTVTREKANRVKIKLSIRKYKLFPQNDKVILYFSQMSKILHKKEKN